MTQLSIGDPAPMFTAPTPSRSEFTFSSVGGRFILLGFLPADPVVSETALEALKADRARFNDTHLMGFMVVRDEARFARAQDERGMRWFFDPDGAVSRAYGALDAEGREVPVWVLLDPSMRVLGVVGIGAAERMLRAIRGLPGVDDHAQTQLHAPVLVVPRVFEPAFCQELMDYYERQGGLVSGVMREVDGKTVGVVDDFKKRRDAVIHDEDMQRAIRARVVRRLLPEIRKAYQFKATRIERYMVACYDAETGGYFRAHRDNTTGGTAHRQFAVSINLNAEGFEGGDLRFPEFGLKTYRPPTGGAVVFSCSLLHEATPVTQGRRYACLPFLYDEASEALRLRNLHMLDVPAEA